MDLSQIAKRVAASHIEKMAFNKENPSDLLRQLVKTLEKESKAAEGKGRKGLDDAMSRVRGITKVVQTAWDGRKEE